MSMESYTPYKNMTDAKLNARLVALAEKINEMEKRVQEAKQGHEALRKEAAQRGIVASGSVNQTDGVYEVTPYSVLIEKVKWDSVDPLLGTMSDYALAEKAGCTNCTIHKRRVKLGIPAYKERSELVNWQDFDKLLATMNNVALAKKIGCTETAVRRRRKKLGIQRALGESQEEVLKTLCRWPGWAYGRSKQIGWVYGSESRTRKILDGLCHRGLVELKGDKYHPTQAGTDMATALGGWQFVV